jgi:hypothetical protein
MGAFMPWRPGAAGNTRRRVLAGAGVVSVAVAVLVRVEDFGEDVADLGDLVEDGGGGCPGWVAVRVASSVSVGVRSWWSCPSRRAVRR